VAVAMWEIERTSLPVSLTVPNFANEGLLVRHPCPTPVLRETNRQAEDAQLDLLAGQIDPVVSAGNMEILSPGFGLGGR
jgi:hypothetical protein